MTAEGEPSWLGEREMFAWRTYVVGSAELEDRLNRELQETHGLSFADYEILVRLSEQSGWRMRMQRLASEVAASKSRLSHQIRRLEKSRLVHRAVCEADARGVVAELTQRGFEVLRAAAPTHVAGVRAHLIDLLTEEEQQMLGEVFARVQKHLRDAGD